MSKSQQKKRDAAMEEADADQAVAQPTDQPIETLLKVDTLELEVGFGLVGLVDTTQGGDLLDRISAIRRQLAQEFGFVMPPVRIRDNMQLSPSEYRVNVRGNTVATAAVEPGKLLAMDSGLATGTVEGEPTKEPAFGLDAWWIEPDVRARAEAFNYTVVDPTSVLATHLTEVVKQHAYELLTRQEVSNLVEGLKERAGSLVDETIPSIVKIADLQKVLQNLLRERVPIRDMETIIETLGDWAPKTNDVEILTEYVRNALRRTICRQHAVADVDGVSRLVCVTLDPAFEDMINSYIDRGNGGTVNTMPARIASTTVAQITESIEKVTASGNLPVVIASPQVRAVVRQLIEPHLPHAAVLGYNEIEPDVEVESMALVSAPQPAQTLQPVGGAA